VFSQQDPLIVPAVTDRLRPVPLALAAWATAWFVLMAWHGGAAWHFFVQGGHALAHAGIPGGGLHLYASAPILQIGPLAFLAVDTLTTVDGRPRLLLGQMLGIVAGGYLVWQVRRIGRRRQRVVALAVACFTPLWIYLAVASVHIDDVLALTCAVAALACARSGRAVWSGVLLGLSVDAKPWALGFTALLLLLPGRRARLHAAAAAVVVIAAAWSPFFLVDHNTVRLLHFTIRNTPLSALRALGVNTARTPPWDRPVQILLGVALGAVAVRRGRWPAVILLAVVARIALDPGTNKYYAAGVAVGALIWDLLGSRSTWPWRSAAGLAVMYLSRWLPVPPWVHGDMTLLYCMACVVWLVVLPGRDFRRHLVTGFRTGRRRRRRPENRLPDRAHQRGTTQRRPPRSRDAVQSWYSPCDVDRHDDGQDRRRRLKRR
jgi:hypothetical protein